MIVGGALASPSTIFCVHSVSLITQIIPILAVTARLVIVCLALALSPAALM